MVAKVLVTGSTGFIGSHLCRALVASGHIVFAFHRPESPTLALQDIPVHHVLGDITQPETLAPALRDIDHVFHTAAFVGRRDPRLIYKTTVEGTRNLLQAALDTGIKKFIHTSTVAALGVPIEQDQFKDEQIQPMDENHSWNYPATWWPYGYTKHLAEVEVQRAVALGLDAVIVNPALVVGEGDLNRIAGDILIRVAKGNIPVAIEGGLNVIHIQDVIRGHLAAFEKGRTGERYILGNENLTHQQFLKMIAFAANRRPPEIILPARLVRALRLPVAILEKISPIPLRAHALHRVGYYFYYDTAKAENELSINKRTSINQAIQEALRWYKKQGIFD